jgi:hypothetical protein
MRFKATDREIQTMGALASAAAKPVGLGFLHARPDDVFKPEDFPLMPAELGFYLDYVNGRMVKVSLHRIEGDEWEAPDHDPTWDYQSWCFKYPTWQALIDAARLAAKEAPDAPPV